jgi:hypothetical protein
VPISRVISKLTDPLTGKELLQKSYDYIDKLTKECAKSLLEEYGKTHRKFQLGRVASELSADIMHWFDRRDKNVRLSFDPSSVLRAQPTQFRLKFKGSTKDADFTMEATTGLFVVPGSEISDQTIAFPKTLALSADRTSFAKRKG